MDGGAALRARAISTSRSIKYWSSGAMLGYGVLLSAARPSRDAHSTATNAKVPNVTVLTIFRFIDFLLRYGFRYIVRMGSLISTGWSETAVALFLIETFLHNRCSRSIRPFANRNRELGDWLRTVAKLRIERDRRVGQIRTPGGFVCQWNVEHQMRYVVPKGVIKVASPRHHVRHRARSRCREFFVVESGLDAVEHLSL